MVRESFIGDDDRMLRDFLEQQTRGIMNIISTLKSVLMRVYKCGLICRNLPTFDEVLRFSVAIDECETDIK